jgi:hypothetical protein
VASLTAHLMIERRATTVLILKDALNRFGYIPLSRKAVMVGKAAHNAGCWGV